MGHAQVRSEDILQLKEGPRAASPEKYLLK